MRKQKGRHSDLFCRFVVVIVFDLQENMIEKVIKDKVADIAGEDVAKSKQVGQAAEKIADAITSKTGGKNLDLPGGVGSAGDSPATAGGSGGGLMGQAQGFLGKMGDKKTGGSGKDSLGDKLGAFMK